MPAQFKIIITKEILERSKYCGTGKDTHQIGRNCAIALALVDIFPNVFVTNHHIFPLGIDLEKEKQVTIPMPVVARQFVKLFDGFCLTPKLRLLLPEFDFIIDVPDEVIGQINIDEVRTLIEGAKKAVILPKLLLT